MKRVLVVEDDPRDLDKFLNAIREIGVFWAVINEAPPGCVPKRPLN